MLFALSSSILSAPYFKWQHYKVLGCLVMLQILTACTCTQVA